MEATRREQIEDILSSINTNSFGNFIKLLNDIGESEEVKVLVNFKINHQNQSFLHLSAFKLQPEFVKIFLVKGSNPNSIDNQENTPLLSIFESLKDCSCETCRKKAVKIISYLGTYGANLDVTNKNGSTPLQMAVNLYLEDVALALIQNGASLQHANSNKPFINTLLESLPHLIIPIFDQAIKMDYKQRHSPNFSLTFDMSIILQAPRLNSCNDVNNSASSLKKKLKEPYREMGFLKNILKTNKNHDIGIYESILHHPLVHVFTDLKWRRLKFMYYIYLVFQTNIIIWYTLFLFLATFVDCPFDFNAEKNGTSFSGNSNTETFREECKISIYTKIIGGGILLSVLVMMGKEFLQFFIDPKVYIRDPFNYIQLVGIGTMVATAIIVIDPISLFHFWLFPLASFGVTICWLQLFLHLGHLPTFAIYVEMLSRVTWNFCISIGVYSCLIIAFAMSFMMLFPSNTRVLDFPTTILHIFTMMLGELNFESLLNPDKIVRNPIMAHLWYFIFLIMISIVLMNLLVGLAVSDISNCLKHSELVVIKRKIEYLSYLENSYYLGTLFTPGPIKRFLRRRIGIVVPPLIKFPFSGKSRDSSTEEDESTPNRVTIYPNKVKKSGLLIGTTSSIRNWIHNQIKAKCFTKSDCKSSNHHANISQNYSEKQMKIPKSSSSGSKTQLGGQDHEDKIISSILERLEEKINELDLKIDDLNTLFVK